jgi:hypothetical protein
MSDQDIKSIMEQVQKAESAPLQTARPMQDLQKSKSSLAPPTFPKAVRAVPRVKFSTLHATDICYIIVGRTQVHCVTHDKLNCLPARPISA